MSEGDDLEEIRKRKREALLRKATQPEPAATEGPPEPIHIRNAEHLTDTLGTYPVVLVDYTAEWCGPCKMLNPILADIARTTPVTLAKIDIDQHQDLARQAHVRSVPTLHLYADGELKDQLVGVQDPGTLKALIDRHTPTP